MSRAVDNQGFYTIDEACKYLGVGEETLYRKMRFLGIESRLWPSLKGGVILKKDVETLKKYLAYPDALH